MTVVRGSVDTVEQPGQTREKGEKRVEDVVVLQRDTMWWLATNKDTSINPEPELKVLDSGLVRQGRSWLLHVILTILHVMPQSI
jgi:hypothetical protein